jgi:hypothetical protein
MPRFESGNPPAELKAAHTEARKILASAGLTKSDGTLAAKIADEFGTRTANWSDAAVWP